MFLFISYEGYAQRSVINRTATYEELYDDPYDVNRLFIHLIPLYGELFSTNINVGWGVKADYYHNDLFDVSLLFRKPYGQKTDFVRDVAQKNSDVLNTPKKFYLFDFGGTYHIVDKEEESESKFVLYTKNYARDNKWETMVPEYIVAPTKRRTIYGARLGMMSYQSSIDMNRILADQGNSLLDTSGAALETQASIFGNMGAFGLYFGGSLTYIKNVAVAFDRTFDNVANDQFFTSYFDILIFPAINVEDIYYRTDQNSPEVIYSADVVETSLIGFRLGMEGKFNRELSWGYGAELGYRPGIKGKGTFAMVRFSFPLFGHKLQHEVEAFGK